MTDVLTQPRPIRLKGRSFLALALTPELPFEDWLVRLDDLAARSAGFFLRRPVVLQEQNSVPGLTNRLLARIADEVHLAFSESRKWFARKDRLKLSGNPVRREILSGERKPALARFGLAEGVPTAFVFGGSRGARRINEATLDAIQRLRGHLNAQFILQTGKEDFGWAREKAEAQGLPVTVVVWYGILAPANTPEPVLAKLRAQVADGLKDPKVQQRLTTLGYQVSYLPGDEFKAFVMKDAEQWKTVAKTAKISLD